MKANDENTNGQTGGDFDVYLRTRNGPTECTPSPKAARWWPQRKKQPNVSGQGHLPAAKNAETKGGVTGG